MLTFNDLISPANRSKKVMRLFITRNEVTTLLIAKELRTVTPSKALSQALRAMKLIGINPVAEWRKSPLGSRYKVWSASAGDKMKLIVKAK